MVQAPDVWDKDNDGNVDSGAKAGQGIKVCIIDSGFYSAHEDLSNVNLAGGVSQVGSAFNTDGFGHGTHVAGTIAGQDNGVGVVGVAPNVSLFIVKFFNDSGSATLASDLIAAAKTCQSEGAKVISMSLGGSRSSGREQRTFDQLNSAGVLSIAAAGNDGNTAMSYPASYSSVMSVAAIDSNMNIADFSQQNSQVEIAAPGVGVLSTVPFINDNSLTVGGTTYQANHIEFSATGTATGNLVDGGLCDSVGSWSGKVVLCERGTNSFYEKVSNVKSGLGVAAVVYNNLPGNFYGTLGDGNSSSIVALSLSQEDGQSLRSSTQSATVTSTFTSPASGYEAWDGTSMATPHVSAVAALLWSEYPLATNQEIRDAMTSTALELGASGRDNAYGYGLVRAAAALNALGGGGGDGGNTAPTVTISSPTNNTTFASGATITFSGSASDVEDDDQALTANLEWKSGNVVIGTGASFSTILSDGTHTITASVTDSGGLPATSSVTFIVGDSGGGGGGGSLSVTVSSDQPTYGKGQTAAITVKVTDGSSNPVSGASVSVTIETMGPTYSGSGTTNSNGEAVFNFRVNPKKDGVGTYTVTATASKTGYESGSATTTFVVQ
ncbi:MAG TPA: peptidase S8 [Chloroflexi bacterium]|nr:peptidase S8 [Chloroflexota bacterium]